ncbi:hypothetical protein [Gramella sp. MAR_2010_147]|uniref:hypothetical protein n=1 Tax=Gramella sp. MAR_2010_147 TaxID=1250205 RepID=UPI0008798C20|nr:hypothetical protein [Gramella sp. MAR_2010_147]SDS11730.1 hypothetical protein SAMN04488553_1514 [Gramella sp. MAR_2010_147]
MNISEKKKTVELLEKLRILNYKSAYIYKIIAGNEKRLILKFFYEKIYHQKLEFLKDIEDKIEQLKKEISPIKDPKLLSFYKRKKCELTQFYLKYKLSHKYADIHNREWKSYKKYRKYLSKINHACVRELLLAHKHKIKHNIINMNNTGVMKFPIA